MNPKKLTESEIQSLIYVGEGWVCDPIERAILVLSYNKEKYAAAYHVEFSNPEFEAIKVFISYKPNGTLIGTL